MPSSAVGYDTIFLIELYWPLIGEHEPMVLFLRFLWYDQLKISGCISLPKQQSECTWRTKYVDHFLLCARLI